jgi:hypothetical protein
MVPTNLPVVYGVSTTAYYTLDAKSLRMFPMRYSQKIHGSRANAACVFFLHFICFLHACGMQLPS